MVQVLDHAVEVAAVELEPVPAAPAGHRLVPATALRPVRDGSRVGGRRAGEPVGEHLQDDRVSRPVGGRGVRAEQEVVDVQDVAQPVPAGRVEPPVAGLAVEVGTGRT